MSAVVIVTGGGSEPGGGSRTEPTPAAKSTRQVWKPDQERFEADHQPFNRQVDRKAPIGRGDDYLETKEAGRTSRKASRQSRRMAR